MEPWPYFFRHTPPKFPIKFLNQIYPPPAANKIEKATGLETQETKTSKIKDWCCAVVTVEVSGTAFCSNGNLVDAYATGSGFACSPWGCLSAAIDAADEAINNAVDNALECAAVDC